MLVSAIPRYLKEASHKGEEQCAVVPGVMKTCQAYKCFSDDTDALNLKHKKWEDELGFTFPQSRYLDGFKDIYGVTNVAKYRSFQCRLLHRAIIKNVHLKHWGKVESDSCYFCQMSRETYSHLFVQCKVDAVAVAVVPCFTHCGLVIQMTVFNRNSVGFGCRQKN